MKDLEERFVEIEKRVKSLVAENKGLSRRVRELEQELEQARRDTQELHLFHGKKIHIREKLDRVLKVLDTLGAADSARDSEKSS